VDNDGLGVETSSCSSSNTITEFDAPNGGKLGKCHSSSYTAYCSSYDENGKCTGASYNTYACTPYVSETYEDGTPKEGYCCSSGYEVQALTTDGTTKVPNGGIVNSCVSSGYTAYCREYDANGKCTSTTSTSSACTPYVERTYDDGTPRYGDCCSSGYEVQALTTDGTTKVSNGGYVNYCVSSGSTAYCFSYDENGKCRGVNYTSGTCTPYKIDLDGVCVPVGRVPYCTIYNTDGKCTSATTSLVKDCKPYRKSATEGACCAGTLETVEGSPYPVCSNRL